MIFSTTTFCTCRVNISVSLQLRRAQHKLEGLWTDYGGVIFLHNKKSHQNKTCSLENSSRKTFLNGHLVSQVLSHSQVFSLSFLCSSEVECRLRRLSAPVAPVGSVDVEEFRSLASLASRLSFHSFCRVFWVAKPRILWTDAVNVWKAPEQFRTDGASRLKGELKISKGRCQPFERMLSAVRTVVKIFRTGDARRSNC